VTETRRLSPPGARAAGPGAADQSAVRAHNLRAVAQLVRERGEIARRDIGDTLAINKATVSSLVTELIGRGLLSESGRRTASEPGRPAAILRLDASTHACVVVEVLADSVTISEWTLGLDRLSERRLDLHPARLGPEATISRIAGALTTTLARLRRQGRTVPGINIALPGLVDARSGQLILSGPLGWEQAPVGEMLRRQRGLAHAPIEVGRIASLATVAEWRRLPQHADLLCLYGGETGLGAGLVVAGQLVTGSHGRAGELLSLQLSGQSPPLGLSDAAARRLAGRAADGELPKTLASIVDEVAARLSSIVALLDPGAVVLGGYLAVLGDRLREPLEARMRSILPGGRLDAELLFGHYGTDAAHVGGAALLVDQVLALNEVR
jgi:predicted NBD/HSP70 family sugar kinase